MIFKRGNSYWYEFVIRGIRYRNSIGKVSKAIAMEVASKERIRILEGKLVERTIKAPLFGHYDPGTGNFSDAAGEYFRFYAANRKPSSVHRMKFLLVELCERFGNKRLTEIDARMIEQYKLHRKAEGMADATVNRSLAALKGLFSMAVRWEIVHDNPLTRVRFFQENNARERYLTQEEEERLLKASLELGNIRFASLVVAGLDTGFRAGELASVAWKDVDFEQREICVASGYTKNGDPRRNPMTRRLTDLLLTLKGNGKVARSALVFGGPYRYQKALAAAREKAGLGKDVLFHTLRHTFISRLVMRGVNLRTVQELAGHREVKMTMRYAHLAPEQKRQAIDILEQVSPQNPPQRVFEIT